MSSSVPFLRVPFLFLLLSVAAVAYSLDTYNTTYPGCPIVECGDVNISYPFWYNPNSNPGSFPSQFCGYKGFGITCPDKGNATFTTLTDNYTVKSINLENKTISLVDTDVLGNTCPKARHNVTISNIPAFNFTPDVVGVLFFFNCSADVADVASDPLIKQNVAGCLKKQSNLSFVFRTDTWIDPYVYARLTQACKGGAIESRVRRSDLERRILGNVFGTAMNNGFDLNWDLNSAGNDNNMADCKKCEKNTGRCGYIDGDGGLVFHCFCPDESPHCYSKGLNKAVKIGIGFAGLGLGIIVTGFVGVFVLRYRKRRLEKRNSSMTSSFFKSVTPSASSFGFGGGDEESPGSGYYKTPMFTYEELEEATGGFSHELGDGGFGTVYKGKLKDGRVVAIKCLHQNTFRRVQQFRNEIEILNRLRHQNLVTLYGCSTRESPKLLLIYEFVSNGTVADHLHGHLSTQRALTWSLRMSVAIESAAALAYLHAVKPQIIHRDVKTTNILLDSDFHVKVADFGLSRLFPDLGVTHVSTAPQGTPGYVDPEYHQCYQLTDKSDVYSFGVVLVELVSSMPAVDISRNRNEINLSNMAIQKIPAGLVGDLADAGLGYGSDSEVTRMVNAVCELAFRCLQQERDMRPSMQEVLDELVRIKGGGDSWGGGKKPGQHDKEKNSSRDDVYLLNTISQSGSSPPFSPNTINGTSWPSRSTATNASC